ncbi:hypothetical protein HanRHA438_Chr10g0439221 [Helianthus annuus]|nr:hypothetical protein HanRHA438_Chr10g0439221 [Helianthus annuus]
MDKSIAKGNHINITNILNGLGLKASLPSWKIRSFGYLSLGRICHAFFSSLVTHKPPVKKHTNQ